LNKDAVTFLTVPVVAR